MKVKLPNGQIHSAWQRAKKMILLVASVMFVSSALIAQEANKAQTGVLKGVVMDQSGETLPGASVLVKGTTTGTVTDLDGNYSLKVPYGSTVVFSFMGYKSLEMVYKGQQEFVARLQSETTNIKNIVVTGLANRKAESYTGAYTAVTGEELKRVGNQNVFQSLKNLDPTLYIEDDFVNGSNPNTLPQMTMRGGTSFPAETTDVNLKGNYQTQPNQPLFLLNGFEVSSEKVYDMDMNTIASLTILKDAAAKAIYGSKAANGVVLIETLALTSDKPRVTYTGSVDLQMPDLSTYDMCNAVEKVSLEIAEKYWIPSSYYGAYDSFFNEDMELLRQAVSGNDTYWLSKPVHFGYGQKHSVQAEFGQKDLRAMFSLNYNNIVGIMKGSTRNNLTGSLTINYRVNNRLRVNNYAEFLSNKSKESPYGSFSEYYRMNPQWNPYDENGLFNKGFGNNEMYPNPLINADLNTLDKSGYIQFMNQTQVEYKVLDALTLRGRFAVTSKRSDADIFYPAEHTSQDGLLASEAGMYRKTNGTSTRLDGSFTANYSKEFGTDGQHIVFANVNIDWSQYKFEELYNTAIGVASSNMKSMMFAAGYGEGSHPMGSDEYQRSMGITFTGSYSYRDRYFTDLTFRTNGSSQFGANNPWATFWSVGLGWNLHNEAFMENVDWVKRFKVTASIGTSGNQAFQNNKSIAVYKYYDDRYDDYQNVTNWNWVQMGAYATNMANPDLKWETKTEKNIGIDAQIWRFSLKADLYQSLTKDMITSLTMPLSTGYTSVYQNIGEVDNSGYEVKFQYNVFQNKNGFLNVFANVVHNKNELKKISNALKNYNESILKQYDTTSGLYGGLDMYDDRMFNKPAILYYDGADLNAIWAVPSAGIDPATGLEVYYGKDGNITYCYKSSDMQNLGSTTPKFRGNFGLNGEWKGIGISVTFNYLTGAYKYNETLSTQCDNCNLTWNVDRRLLTEKWQRIDQDAYFKRFEGYTAPYDYTTGLYSSGNGWQRSRATGRFVQKRNDLNISSITVYYDFNKSLIKRWGMERLKVSAYMNDVAQFSTIEIERGTSYPFSRTVSLALTATF